MEKNTSSASSLTGSTTPVRHGPQLTVWSKGMENKKKECRTRDREFKGHGGPLVGSKINTDRDATKCCEGTGLTSPVCSSKQMHFKQAQGAPLLTMTNDSTWSFPSLLT